VVIFDFFIVLNLNDSLIIFNTITGQWTITVRILKLVNSHRISKQTIFKKPKRLDN